MYFQHGLHIKEGQCSRTRRESFLLARLNSNKTFPRTREESEGLREMVFGTAVRWAAKKGKPKMKPVELTSPPEQAQSISRAIFDVVKEHGPLTLSDTWDHIKGIGLRGLTGKRQMKIMIRWMRERQKLRQICCHNGAHKQFLYTTWFTNPKNTPLPPRINRKDDPKP
ncbi:hypothetical protein LUZ60_013660 [Juncus effusus]|nr:hypothetical protein LUZ60_013660 [Juncus effusus]